MTLDTLTPALVHATRLQPGDFIPADALLYPHGCWEVGLDDVRYEYRGGPITHYAGNLVEGPRVRVPVTIHQGEGLCVSGARREFRCSEGGHLSVVRPDGAGMPELLDIYMPPGLLDTACAPGLARWRALLPLGTVARLQREGGWVRADELETALDGLGLRQYPARALDGTAAWNLLSDLIHLAEMAARRADKTLADIIRARGRTRNGSPNMEHRVRLTLLWLAEESRGLAP